MLYSLCARAVGGMEKGYLDRGLNNWRATGRMMRSIIKSRRMQEPWGEKEKKGEYGESFIEIAGSWRLGNWRCL